jgi:hypothetical protein
MTKKPSSGGEPLPRRERYNWPEIFVATVFLVLSFIAIWILDR